MAGELHKLSPRFFASVKDPGRYSDGGGLYLVISPTGARRWAFLYKRGGRQRELGLGAAGSDKDGRVGLASAREKAAEARRQLAEGIDPIDARRAQQAESEERRPPTFLEAASEYIERMNARWRNPKHAQQWRTTLLDKGGHGYARTIHDIRVADVSTADVLAILQPLWREKAETASRVRGRIEAVLDASIVQGHRTAANPARWRGHLDKVLPQRQKLQRGHHAAMPYQDVPAFVTRLKSAESVSALALEFTILTAARSGEVLGATWDEVDLESAVWTVPAARMKAGRVHRVALSESALAIVQRLREARTCEFVFPSARRKMLSNMAMLMAMRRLGVGEYTVHGFRSSFRDWVGEATDFSREIAEAALAHSVGDATERAYRRSDALERRRLMMVAWAQYIEAAKEEK